MTKEELKEYCKKVMEEEHKQTILNFMIEIETLKLINKNLQSKIDQQDQIIREAREYVNFIAIAKIAFAEEEEMLNPFVRFSKTKWGKELLEILDRNVNNE